MDILVKLYYLLISLLYGHSTTSPTVRKNFIATLGIPPPQQFIPITTAVTYCLINFTVVPTILTFATMEPIPKPPKRILFVERILLKTKEPQIIIGLPTI